MHFLYQLTPTFMALVFTLTSFAAAADTISDSATETAASHERRCEAEGWRCQNGGRCDAFFQGDPGSSQGNRLVCMCPIGYTGLRCETEGNFRFPEFHGNGYIAFEFDSGLISGDNLDLSLELLPRLANGLVLFAGTSTSFFALLLRDNKLQIRFDTGSSGLSELTHPAALSLRAWHSVTLHRSAGGGKAWLQVNGTRQHWRGSAQNRRGRMTAAAPAARDESDSRNAPRGSLLYVAGVPRSSSTAMASSSAAAASGRVGLNTDAGFVGCLGNLTVGGRLLDPRRRPFHGDAAEGVNVYDCAMATCNHHRCLNRGQCKVLRPPDMYMCLCDNATGAYCQHPVAERIIAPSFDGSGHLTLRNGVGLRRTSRSRTDVRLTFRAEQPDGLLLYAGLSNDRRGDFLAIGLLQRRVLAAFDLGSGTAVIRSRQPIDLHAWVTVEFTRLGRRGRLWVSGQEDPEEAFTPGNLVQLTVQLDTYLGGHSDFDSVSAVVPIRQNFVGCVHEVSFGELGSPEFPRDIKASVNIRQCGNFTCSGLCGGAGVCVRLRDRRGFGCQCPLGLLGPRCERALDPREINAPQFDGNGYLLFRSQDLLLAASSPAFNLSLSLKLRPNYGSTSSSSKQAATLLLLSAQSLGQSRRQLHLTVTQRHLSLHYNEGYGLRSRRNLHYFDHNWHSLTVARSVGKYSVIVDGLLKDVVEDQEIGSSDDHFVQLLIGGIDRRTWQLNRHHLTEASSSRSFQWPPMQPVGFDGCLMDVVLQTAATRRGESGDIRRWRLVADAASEGRDVRQCAAEAESAVN